MSNASEYWKFLPEMNSVLWIVTFSNVSQNIKLTEKTMNSKMMNSVLMNSKLSKFGKYPEITSCDSLPL